MNFKCKECFKKHLLNTSPTFKFSVCNNQQFSRPVKTTTLLKSSIKEIVALTPKEKNRDLQEYSSPRFTIWTNFVRNRLFQYYFVLIIRNFKIRIRVVIIYSKL